MKKNDWLIIFLIVLLSCFTLKDLYKPFFYTSHDGVHQVVRLYYFDQLLRDGQIPPRWVGGLFYGFGYPLFIFSYHLPWIIAEIPYLLGFSIFASIKFVFLFGFVFSGITMYLFLKEIYGRFPSLIGTVLYLFAPYHFSNIFVRASIGDATAFIFPPIIFLVLYKLRKEKKINFGWIILGSFSLACLLLSHAMVFLFFLGTFFLYIFFWLVNCSKFLRRTFFFSSLIVLLFGLGLSAYYLIPSLVERNYTNFSEIMSSVYQGVTFLTLRKILYSPWGYGTMDAKEGAMSLQVGIAQWLTVFSFFIILIYSLVKKKIRKDNIDLFKEAIFYFFVFLSSIFLILPVSFPFWKFINKVAFIDFSWRIFPLIIFVIAILGSFVISRLKYPWLLAGLLIFFAFYGNRNHLRINQILDWPVSFYLKLEKTTNSFDEYTPVWVKKDLIKENSPKAELIDTQGEIEIIKNKSNYLELLVKTPKEGKLQINTIYYPGWEVFVDKKPVPINYQGKGLMEISIDEGEKRVIALFKETKLRLFSNLLSLSSIFTLIILGIIHIKKLV